MEEHKFIIEYDYNAYDIIAEVNKITSKHGITFDFDDEPHDGFDICIVKINK